MNRINIIKEFGWGLVIGGALLPGYQEAHIKSEKKKEVKPISKELEEEKED